MSSGLLLLDLPRDIHINVLLYLRIRDLLSIRKTCKFFDELTRLRSIWLNACFCEVISKGIPFPYKLRSKSLADLARIEIGAIELEHRTRYALALKAAWLGGVHQSRRTLKLKGGPANGLQSVHFVLRRKQEWIVTLSGGIWPAIGCWDLSIENEEVGNLRSPHEPMKVGEWACKGATMNALVVDQNIDSDTCFAVSVDNYSRRRRYIEIQSIRCIPNTHDVSFHTIKVLNTDYSPILLDGNIIAISDEYAETKILNWRTGDYAILKSEQNGEGIAQHNKCLQVLLADEAILVARFRSIEIFAKATLHLTDEDIQTVFPLQTFTHGWINGMVMTPLHDPTSNTFSSIGILMQVRHVDPWACNIPFVIASKLLPNPSYSPLVGSSCPYQFPPQRVPILPAMQYVRQCSPLALGSAGTAFWVGEQDLNALLLTGTMNDQGNSSHRNLEKPSSIFRSEGDLWTSMDYVESRGCIALGAVDGFVKILYIA